MLGFLLLLLAVALLCAWLAPGCELGLSAARALEASALSMTFEQDDLDEVGPASATTPARTQRPEPAQAARRRPRVTPFQAKHVASRQQWRCGCGCVDPNDEQGRGFVLDASYEIDHKVPLRWGGTHDPSNRVAVLRSHHQHKSARESQRAALARRRN